MRWQYGVRERKGLKPSYPRHLREEREEREYQKHPLRSSAGSAPRTAMGIESLAFVWRDRVEKEGERRRREGGS